MRVEELARLVDGKLRGDTQREIRGVASLESAGPNELAFVEGARALGQAARSRAGCLLVAEGVSVADHTTIAVARPKVAFIRVAEALHPPEPVEAGIHPTAVVAPDAEVAQSASVGAYVVIEAGAKIGAGTRLDPGVFVGQGVSVGAQCRLYPRVTLYPGTTVGNRVILHAGVVVGSDGFGYVFAEGRHLKFPQLGRVMIEDDVEVGSNSTIDRGSLGTTVIGRGTKLDNLVQVGHNVRLGMHCVIAAQTGISGSVEIGNGVVMGGQVGIGDHVRIGDRVTIGGQAGILPGKTLRLGSTVWGTPARPFDEYKKLYAHLSNLPRLSRQVKELSRPAPRDRGQARRRDQP